MLADVFGKQPATDINPDEAVALGAALTAAIEAAELAELFLWKTNAEVESSLSEVEFREALADELADVQTYLLYLAHAAGIDLEQAVYAKIKKNEAKYPVEKAKGNARKYDRFDT